MIQPGGFASQPFATSPFAVGYRDLVFTVGTPVARGLSVGRLRARTLSARLEAP